MKDNVFIRCLLITFLIFNSKVTISQNHIVFNVNLPQPPPEIATKSDTSLSSGNSINLGLLTTIDGGTAPFIYQWKPETYLDNASIFNPIATPESDIKYTLVITDSRGCTAEDSISINLRTTNLSEINLEYNKIYPNPTSGDFTIEVNSKKNQVLYCRIINMVGEIVYKKNFQITEDELHIQTDLTPGYYLVEIHNNSDIKLFPLIIKQ